MVFILALDLSDVDYYGHIPELPHDTCRKAEAFELDPSDWLLLDEDFIDPINALCGTLLDNGDVDYFNEAQCALLSNWLGIRLGQTLDTRLAVLYTKLKEFSDRAILLGTGVVVEL